ncbi:Heat shock protein GrpE [Fulvivirga imtechensis AK7]|uniref:Protein GrpE n=1 Tax=Fulvivirga imtechensis AK7 TaxID=1237149 RepID=L8JTU3_9BACT|nr:nucleotide exchange factor GrpE [Fulvivirga imtechensis]ELR70959.1 Heat shock protein GrpE [Fulvivirga imtechensis AK7]
MNKENIDEKELKDTQQSTESDDNAAEMGDTPDNLDEIKEGVESKSEQNDQAEASETEKKLLRLEDELAESKDKYLRLYSEFENFRRRTAKEKLEMVQTANEDLMQALIPIIDDFERAEKSFEDEKTDLEAAKEGVQLIYNKFKKVLEQKGLKAMEGKEGMDFDPEFHEAITQIPAPKKNLKGKVVDVVEKGYMLKEKVIRYAKVVIGN